MKTIFEKSIVSARDLKSGDVLTFNDLAYKKPGNGIPAATYNNLLGKELNCDVPKDTPLQMTMFIKPV